MSIIWTKIKLDGVVIFSRKQQTNSSFVEGCTMRWKLNLVELLLFPVWNIKIKTSNCSDSTINFQVKLKNEFHLKVWNNSGYNAFSNFCMGLNTTTLHKLTKSSLNVFEPSRSLHTLFLLHSLCFGSGLFAAAVPHVLNSKVDWARKAPIPPIGP